MLDLLDIMVVVLVESLAVLVVQLLEIEMELKVEVVEMVDAVDKFVLPLLLVLLGIVVFDLKFLLVVLSVDQLNLMEEDVVEMMEEE